MNAEAEIASPHVTELLSALLDRRIPPTRSEVEKVAKLIYEIGKNDGALEVCENLMRKESTEAATRG